MTHTTLVTGGTGYIGSWVVKGLLEKGHTVRLTVRDKKRKEKYQFLETIARESKGTLEIWEADLLKEGSFDKAAKGCDLITHMASPFILNVKDPQRDLIDPAVLGTTNILEAANRSTSVRKVVLTSSIAAIYGDSIDMRNQQLDCFSEKQFNTSSSLTHQPYSFSKTEAEKRAWEIAKKQSEWKLVVINPTIVMGPSLSAESRSESLKIMTDILSGKYRFGVPALYFGFVDVRNVAQAHIFALENQAEGRHILAERVTDMLSFTNIIKDHFPKRYKLPKSFAPKWLIRILAPVFGITPKFVDNNVGIPIKLDATKSRDKLQMQYRPLEQTILEMIEQVETVKKDSYK